MQEEHFNSLSKIVLILEYNGKAYHGFQWQKGQPTVQASLEEAIFKAMGENRRVISASRTDAGVHASFQVVSFSSGSRLDTDTLQRALNYYLPGDIVVKAAGRVEPSFHVRRDAVSREYVYTICSSRVRAPLLQGFALQVTYKFEIDEMNRACQELEGEHDFISFAADGGWARDTRRTIYRAVFIREGKLVKFHIKANSFLTHQVRNTVGFLLGIGSGKQTIDELKRIMAERKVGLAGPAVAPCGLCLTRVNYTAELELKYENLFSQSG